MLSASQAASLAIVVTFGASPAMAGPALVRVETALPKTERVAPDIALTGTIAARVQSNLAFRMGGKVVSRQVEVGQHVRADDVIATLDGTEAQTAVDTAQATLASARAQLQQAQETFARQKALIDTGYTTRASYDQAQAGLDTAEAQVRAAEAALDTAREQFSYTVLRAGADGIIVSRSLEVGQVVQAGQAVIVLAQDGARDAVFNVPEVLVTHRPSDRTVDVALEADPSVTALGTIREVSPILDPATATVLVKIGLDDPPPRLQLGAAVVGRAHWQQTRMVRLPWSALFEADGRPAVWRVAPDHTVSLSPVTVERYETGSVLLAADLEPDRPVVTAGVQFLHPGQTVEIVSGEAP